MRHAKLTAPDAVLMLLCAMYLILYVDRVNLSIAAPLIKTDLRLSNFELGLALSAFAYAYAPFQLIGGVIGNRFGARRTLCVALFVVCATTAATAAVTSIAALFAVRVVLGVGEGAALPTATHAMSSWMPASRWGFAQGITHSFARFGNFVTPALVAALIASFSWRAAFIMLAAASLVWMAVWGWYFRDSPSQHPAVTPADLSRLPPVAATGGRPVPWLRLLWRMWPATAVNFCYGWTLWLFLTWIPSFFVQNYGLALASSAVYATGVFFGGVVGDSLGGVMSDAILRRSGNVVLARRSVIVAGFIGACLCFLPVVLIHNLAVSAICLSLAFFFAELIVAPIWAVPMDIAPHHAGAAAGMMNFGSAFAGIVSPAFFGYMVDATGTWTIAYAASIVLLLVGALLAFLLHPDVSFMEEPWGDPVPPKQAAEVSVEAAHARIVEM